MGPSVGKPGFTSKAATIDEPTRHFSFSVTSSICKSTCIAGPLSEDLKCHLFRFFPPFNSAENENGAKNC